ncbi:MAG TPA: PadR family transcriptional regulator [Candidatus Saccharimonadales bacterium]|nr:PadR family transcriptional regulator [Candidatus Saccharimonadales bacterium]
MSRNAPGFLPQVAFSILLALSLKPRHGYELIQQIEEDSGGKIKLGPGALYGAIHQLCEEKLITETAVQTDNPRRKYYQLTANGRKRLSEEMRYFETSISLAKKRHVFGASKLA